MTKIVSRFKEKLVDNKIIGLTHKSKNEYISRNETYITIFEKNHSN